MAIEEPDKFIDGEKEVEDDSERDKYEQLCREALPLVSNLYNIHVLYSARVYVHVKHVTVVSSSFLALSSSQKSDMLLF